LSRATPVAARANPDGCVVKVAGSSLSGKLDERTASEDELLGGQRGSRAVPRWTPSQGRADASAMSAKTMPPPKGRTPATQEQAGVLCRDREFWASETPMAAANPSPETADCSSSPQPRRRGASRKVRVESAQPAEVSKRLNSAARSGLREPDWSLWRTTVTRVEALSPHGLCDRRLVRGALSDWRYGRLTNATGTRKVSQWLALSV
jgi:hypothetical protein